MKLQPVTSTNIYATGHNEKETTYIRFLSGDTYAYSPQTAEDHAKLRAASSIGAALGMLKKKIPGTKVETWGLAWSSEDDANGNTTWTAPSPLTDEGAPFLWRLKPTLYNNQVEWWEYHDLELMDAENPRSWPTIGCAKAGIEDLHAEISAALGLSDPEKRPQPHKPESLCESCAPDDGPCEMQRHGIVAVGGSCNRYQEIFPI